MNYKKIFKKREVRLKLLNLFDFIPDKLMLYMQYWIKFGKLLDLNNPKTYNEKIQWYKLYHRDPLMVKCVDKYEVRNYIEKKGLSHILNECYGLYNKPEEINFKNLPKRFVLKATNGGGGMNIIICKNKNNLDKNSIIKKMKQWIKPIKTTPGREWVYTKVKPRIICEKFLENKKNSNKAIRDYKFFCFNGVPKFVEVDVDRFNGHKRNMYDANWNYIDETLEYPRLGDVLERPDNFEEMKKIASILSEDFPHVRVDLYNQNGRIIFGEMTFFPDSGYGKFSSNILNKRMGEVFELPKKKIFN